MGQEISLHSSWELIFADMVEQADTTDSKSVA